jgi:serralysin
MMSSTAGLAATSWLAGGNDSFVFDTIPGPANYDRILDFCSADDVFRLDSAVFVGLAAGALDAEAFVIGEAAIDGNDRIVYNECSGGLLFDPDGAGGETAVRFAMVNSGTSLSADDFIFF